VGVVASVGCSWRAPSGSDGDTIGDAVGEMRGLSFGVVAALIALG
jgi:hypothetical protein